jgi:hypothetical protein
MYFPYSIVCGDLLELNFTSIKELDLHYSKSISFYYGKRENPKSYLIFKDYCLRHISIGQDVYNFHIEQNRKKVKKYISGGGKIDTELEKIIHTSSKSHEGKWLTYIPHHCGFFKLSTVLEKEGKYKEAMDLCKRALKIGFNGEWGERIERIERIGRV